MSLWTSGLNLELAGFYLLACLLSFNHTLSLYQTQSDSCLWEAICVVQIQWQTLVYNKIKSKKENQSEQRNQGQKEYAVFILITLPLVEV